VRDKNRDRVLVLLGGLSDEFAVGLQFVLQMAFCLVQEKVISLSFHELIIV